LKGVTKEKIRSDLIIFNLLLIVWLSLQAVVLSSASNINLIQFIMSACFIFSAVAGYNLGLIPGLMTSLIFAFAYGTYLLYGIMVSGTIRELRLDLVIWLFVVPLVSYLTGLLNSKITSLIWQVEKYSLSSDLITIDELTGFLNQQAFFKKLEEEMARARRFKTELSLIVVVIANNSEMRAIYGKKGFEDILKSLSSTIDSTIRNIDSKGLIDIETFAMILPGTPLEGAGVVQDKLNRSLERLTVDFDGKKKVIKLRVRIGKANFNDDTEDSLVFYDRAMENSKYDMG